jgi:hypothetical protein
MSEWYDFYAERANERYYRHVCTKYEKHIETVQMLMWLMHTLVFTDDPVGQRFVSKHINVVEIGSGLGNVTRAIHNDNEHFQFGLVDNDLAISRLSEDHSGLRHARNVNFHLYDFLDFCSEHLWKNKDTTIIHSHGLLEHFSKRELKQDIFPRLKESAKAQVHYVPTAKYGKPSFGDERLWTPQAWRKVCNPDRMITFNDGYDLLLIWDAYKINIWVRLDDTAIIKTVLANVA